MEDGDALMARLSPGVRAVAPDMPGYGAADRPRRFDYTVEGYAAHLDGILGQLGVERAHLVLHDFGGPWGLRWAADHPSRVGSITLINTGVLLGYKWHKFARIWQTPVVGELFSLTANKPLLRRLLNADNPKPFPDEFVDRIWSHMDWGHKRAVLKLYRANRRPEVGMRPLADALSRMNLPVLVVWGAEDAYLPEEFAVRQGEWLRGADIHVLRGLGHWPFIDDLDQVASLVIPFLEREARTAAAS
jgi:pimeloyl-ACP methyl ester carboxylesterase